MSMIEATKALKYDKGRILQNARAKKYYDINKDEINRKRRERRALKNTGNLAIPLTPQPQQYNPAQQYQQAQEEDFDYNDLYQGQQYQPQIENPAPKQKKGKQKIPVFSLEDGLKVIRENTEIKPTSKKGYKSHWNTTQRILGFKDFVEYFRKHNAEFVKNKIDNGKQKNGKPYKINALKTYYQIIVWMIDHGNLNEWIDKEPFVDNFSESKLDSQDELKHKQETEVYLNFNNYYEDVKNVLKEDHPCFLVASIMKQICCRDNFYLKIVSSKEQATNKDTNYLVVPNTRNGKIMLIYNEYKTDKKYDKKTFEASASLAKIIKSYITKNNLNYNQYLFNKEKIGGDIIKWNKKVYPNSDKSIGIQYMRHMVISTELSKFNISNRDRIELAGRSFHDFFVTQKDYKRMVDELNK